MSTEYRIFKLTPGQRAPQGSTGITIPNEGMMWIGEENTFPSEADVDTNINGVSTTYINREATEEEIGIYARLLLYRQVRTEFEISFESRCSLMEVS